MKPILFNTEMVRAILDGRKTVTRRVIKVDCPDDWYCENDCRKHPEGATVPCYISRKVGTEERGVIYPKYDVDDVLWVRETWNSDWCDHAIYRADGGSAKSAGYTKEPKWRPSIHMPKEAARIFLRVTGVRVERVQEITEAQAQREGIIPAVIDGCVEVSARGRFKATWIDIYGMENWQSNPWVWVIEFERCEKPQENI